MQSLDIDTLPINIRESKILTNQHLKLLTSVAEVPVVDPSFYDERLKNIFQYYSINPEEMEKELHLYAAELLEKENLAAAWQVLLTGS